jgi:hypothetical protein
MPVVRLGQSGCGGEVHRNAPDRPTSQNRDMGYAAYNRHSGGRQLNYLEGHNFVRSSLSDQASAALATLLESKHLYQKVVINFDEIVRSARSQVESSQQRTFDVGMDGFSTHLSIGERARIGKGKPEPVSPALLLRNLKLFCSNCNAAEVFSPLWEREIGAEIGSTRPDNPTLELPLKNSYQLFIICYQCQRCKADPVTFTVRRHGWQLILDGRSPMESIEVPREIPKAESHFYRDSIIAFQSGKSLPGILYLRVFLEVFSRRQTGCNDRMAGDDLMDEYANLIPIEKRSLMPSLKEWYGKLSEAIHAGREDGELYQLASADIYRHFEFRRIFEISDVTAEPRAEGSRFESKPELPLTRDEQTDIVV